MSNETTDKFLEKHKPLSLADVQGRIKAQHEVKQEHQSSQEETEKNLLNFLQEDHPVFHPVTEKPLFWIRQPTYQELDDWRNRFKKVKTMTLEEAEAYLETEEGQLGQFKIMADIITNPKKPATWWKENANPTVEQLFEVEVLKILKSAYGDASFF